MIHPRVVFLGDPAAATPWIGFAKKLARECYTLKIAHKVYKVGSGIEIRVENIFPPTGAWDGISKVWIEAGGYAHKFIIYPRNESYPYGMDDPFEGQIGVPMPRYFDYRTDCDASDDYKCFSHYAVKETSFKYTNGQKSYSGNQFFVDGKDVYSYWGSPYGDLPIGYSDLGISAPDYDYMPYLQWVRTYDYTYSFPTPGRMRTEYYAFNYKIGGIACDVPVNDIYKNGQLFCRTAYVIVGVGVVVGSKGKKVIALTAEGRLLVIALSGSSYDIYPVFRAARSSIGGEWSDYVIDHVVRGLYLVSGRDQFSGTDYYELRNVGWPFYEYKVSPDQNEFCILYQKSTTPYDNPVYTLAIYSIESDETTHGFTPVLASFTDYQATYTDSGRPEGQQVKLGASVWFSTDNVQAPLEAWYHNNTGEEFEIPAVYAESDDQDSTTWNRTASLVGTLPLAVGYKPNGTRTLLTLIASDSLSESGDFQYQAIREYGPWDTKSNFIYYPANTTIYALGGARIGTSTSYNNATGSYSYTTSGTYTLSLGGVQLDQAVVGQTVSLESSDNETYSVTASWRTEILGGLTLNYIQRETNMGVYERWANIDLLEYYPAFYTYSVTSTKNTVNYNLRYVHIPSGTVLYAKLVSGLSGTYTVEASGNVFLNYDSSLYTFKDTTINISTDVKQTSVYREIATFGTDDESETVFSIPHTIETDDTTDPTKSSPLSYSVSIPGIDAYTGPGRPGSIEGFSGSFTFNGIHDNKVFFAADTRQNFIPWMLVDWIPANYNQSGNAQVTTIKASFQSPLASPGGWATEISPIGLR